MATADITTITSVFTAVGGLIVTAFGYVGYQNRRDRLVTIRKAFDEVVGSLATDNEEQRLAGAILLRRFFDETSELGLRSWLSPRRRAPYAQEAMSVIAAVLRGLETGNFQKLLADSLAYAPDLKGVDLQKTNLQNGYLVPRRKGVTLERADFYRADLSSASLKKARVPKGIFYQARLCHTVFKEADLCKANFYQADLTGAQFDRAKLPEGDFYQARLYHTVFKEADLRKANFYQADLTGAQFDGAKLSDAKFKDARNVPQELLPLLDEHGTYISDQPGPKGIIASAAETGISSIRRVFLSLPSHRTMEQQALVERFTKMLEENGFVAEELPRSEYPQFGQLSEVRRRISGCCGIAIFGFCQPGDENLLLPGTTGSPPIQRPYTPTPWNHIEASIAFVLDLPLLIMPPAEFDQGIFDRTISEQSTYRLPLDSDWAAGPAKAVLSNWTSAVLERANRGS